jgi:hypothetical protein
MHSKKRALSRLTADWYTELGMLVLRLAVTKFWLTDAPKRHPSQGELNTSESFENRHVVWMLSATLIATATGCGANIAPSELLGAWTISRSSRHLFPPDFDVSSATLILKSDETFIPIRLPQEIVLIHATGSDAIAPHQRLRQVGVTRANWASATPQDLCSNSRPLRAPRQYKLPFSTIFFSVSKARAS